MSFDNPYIMLLRSIFILLTSSTLMFAQRGGRHTEPVIHEVSNKTVVQSIYPDAVKVEKVNELWYQILNKENKVIGYAMNSQTVCAEIKGYKGVTPVMIMTDKKGKIQKVSLLTHCETLSYVRLLEESGFFNQWNDKSLKDAVHVALDAYSGATETALAVEKHVRFLLQKGGSSFPGRKK